MRLAVSDPFLQDGSVQLSLKASTPVRMRSTDSAWLFKRFEHNYGTNSFQMSVGQGAERVLKFNADKDNVLQWLNDYRVSKKNMKRKLSKQDVNLMVNTTSVRWL